MPLFSCLDIKKSGRSLQGLNIDIFEGNKGSLSNMNMAWGIRESVLTFNKRLLELQAAGSYSQDKCAHNENILTTFFSKLDVLERR